jgi:hypothetical protein
MTSCLIAALVSVSLLRVESPDGLADVELVAPIHRNKVPPWIRECVGLLFVLPVGPVNRLPCCLRCSSHD